MSDFARRITLPEAPPWTSAEDVARYAAVCLAALRLEQWHFEWDKTVRRLGCCKPAKHSVSLSVFYVHKYLELDQGQIRRTLLHELAHALAWEYNHSIGHDAVWHGFCAMLGIGDETCRTRCEDFSPPEFRERKPLYVLCHKETGEVFHRYYAKPRRSHTRISSLYIRGRKEETLGKLCIRPVE